MTSEKIIMFVASHSKDFDMAHIPQIKSILDYSYILYNI